MTEEQTQVNQDWREDISEPAETLKIADKESVVVTFLDEGEARTHSDYGTSIVFGVEVVGMGKPMKWYVNAKNFDLLGQIKALGKLTGNMFEISRTGSKKSDTRYHITKK